MTHTFKRGVLWQAGASGNFIFSQFVPPEDILYSKQANEYKILNNKKYFLRISKEILPEHEMIACHPFPFEWIENNDIYIDELLMIKPNWFTEIMLYSKRMMQFRISPNDLVWMVKEAYYMSKGKEINWHNFQDVQLLIRITERIKNEFSLDVGNIQEQVTLCVLYMVWLKSNALQDTNENLKQFVNEQIVNPCMKAVENNTHLNTTPYDEAVPLLMASGKIGVVHNVEYEDMFIDCNTVFGITKQNIKEYSLKNVDLLTKILTIAERFDLVERVREYGNRLNNVDV